MKAISIITEPKLTFTILLIYISIFRNNNLIEFFVYLLVIIISLLLVKRTKDKNLVEETYEYKTKPEKSLRISTYLLTIIMSILMFLFAVINSRQSDLSFSLILIVLTIIMLVFAILGTKLSAHLMYTALIILYFFEGVTSFIIMLLVLPFVAFSRVKLKKHSIKQIFMTAILIVIVSIIRALIK